MWLIWNCQLKRSEKKQINLQNFSVIELPRDKTNNVVVRPAKTQISLGIHPVWSESSLTAWRKHGSLATHWAHSEDSDQTGHPPSLIWVFAGRTGHFVRFVTGWLNYYYRSVITRLWQAYFHIKPHIIPQKDVSALGLGLILLSSGWYGIWYHVLFYLFDLWLYVPVNNYGHVETVS